MDNPMRQIRIEKITLNIGLGSTGNVEDAKKILQQITGKKPVVIKTKKRSTFGVPKGKEIGVKVTIRRNKEGLLQRLFDAKDNIIKKSNFDNTGNLSFGIREYIDIPEMEYDPKIGIMGLDVCVTLERPGFSIKRKKLSKKVGKKHLISKEDAIDFIKNNFNVEIR